jgi:hypothetical protein
MAAKKINQTRKFIWISVPGTSPKTINVCILREPLLKNFNYMFLVTNKACILKRIITKSRHYVNTIAK